MMSVLAPTLSDQDIDDLAAYYASIPVTVGKPPQ
jgi:cytochrome c553